VVVGQGVTSRFFDFGVVGRCFIWGRRSLGKTGPQSVVPQRFIWGRRSNKWLWDRGLQADFLILGS